MEPNPIALVQGDAMRVEHTGDLFAGDPITSYEEVTGTYTTLSTQLQEQEWWGSSTLAQAAAREYGFTADGVTEYFAYNTLTSTNGVTRIQAVFVKSDGTLGNINLQVGASNTFVVEETTQAFNYPWLNSDAQVNILG
jgi:hypothetical protein